MAFWRLRLADRFLLLQTLSSLSLSFRLKIDFPWEAGEARHPAPQPRLPLAWECLLPQGGPLKDAGKFLPDRGHGQQWPLGPNGRADGMSQGVGQTNS